MVDQMCQLGGGGSGIVSVLCTTAVVLHICSHPTFSSGVFHNFLFQSGFVHAKLFLKISELQEQWRRWHFNISGYVFTAELTQVNYIEITCFKLAYKLCESSHTTTCKLPHGTLRVWLHFELDI